jgi:uncharacterized protein (DUF305 family)
MNPMRKIVLALMAAGMLIAVLMESAPAQDQGNGAMGNMQMGGMQMASDSPATAGYKAAMDKMHADMMAVQYSGDADVDFVRGMIPHHQAAVDMAKVLLANGKDPEMHKLAENIVSTQQAEIKQMQDWLAAHPAK